jgi:hypothetical protein
MKSGKLNRRIVYCLIVFFMCLAGCAAMVGGRRFYSGEPRPIRDIAILAVVDGNCRVDSITESGKPKKNLTGGGDDVLGELLPGNYAIDVRYVNQGVYSTIRGKSVMLSLHAEPGHVYFIYPEFPTTGGWHPSLIDIANDEDYNKLEGMGKPSNFKKSINVYISGERKEIQKVFTTKDGEHLWR